MSEQTPLKKTETAVAEHSHSSKKQVKKSSPVGAFRLLVAAALIAGGVWLSQQKLDGIPDWMSNVWLPAAVVLALLVFLLGNAKRLTAYIGDSVKEVKKVVWPDRAYTVRMTIFVIIFVAVMAVFIYAVDTLISWLFFDLLLKRG